MAGPSTDTAHSLDLLGDLQKAFELFDRNGDGKIDKDELRLLFCETNCPVTDEQLEGFMCRIDAEGEGSIDYPEFCHIMKEVIGPALEMEDHMSRCFKAMDKNEDGFISAEELRDAFGELGRPMDLEEAEQIVCVFDKNRDGVIDYDEFITMMYMMKMA